MITRLTVASEIAAAVAAQQDRLRRAGQPEQWAEVGTVYRDQYLQIVRDAVRFPSGKLGTFIRIERSLGAKNGVLGVPWIADRYLFVKHWRYATGRFHLEFPRGFTDAGEEADKAIVRELHEEVSAGIVSVEPIGVIFSDPGLLNWPVNVYAVELSDYSRGDDTDEGIDAIELLTEDEVFARIRAGQIDDSLTLSAFAQFMAWKKR